MREPRCPAGEAQAEPRECMPALLSASPGHDEVPGAGYLGANKSNQKEVCKTITSNNPAFMMRNHLVEQIIQELLTDKKDTLNKALECIEKPFEKIKYYEKMYVGPTKEQEVLRTFCGT